MALQKRYFPIQDIARQRNVGVWLAKVAIPFRNFIFENHGIAKRIPGQGTGFAMILVGVLPPMCEHYIGIGKALLQAFNPELQFGALIRKITIAKGGAFNHLALAA